MESNKPIAYWTDDERWMIDDGEHGFPREADQDEIALAEALRERDACHAIWDELFRIMGYAPEGPRPMLVDAVRALAQGIVKEGPSVEDAMKAVHSWWLEQVVPWMKSDACQYEGDTRDIDRDLERRFAALFTKSQIDPTPETPI